MSDSFDPLLAIDAYLDGEWDADDAEQLRAWLEADAAHAEIFAERAFLHSRLNQIHAPVAIRANPAAAAATEAHDERGSVHERWIARLPDVISPALHPIRFGVFVMAATLLIYVGLLNWILPWWHQRQQPHDPGTILARREVAATIIQQFDVQWEQGAIAWQTGAQLNQGRDLRFVAGRVELRFVDGAQVLLDGPCRFTVQSPAACELSTGKAVALAPPAAVGFTVNTPAGQIVDLGTEFAVAVDTQGDSDVHVFQGKVEARLLSSAGIVRELVVLQRGESARLEAGRGAITSARMDPTSFNRMFSPPKSLSTSDSLPCFDSDWAVPFMLAAAHAPINGFDATQVGYDFASAAFGSFHTGGCQFVLGDGSVHFLSETMDHSTYQQLAVRADGQPVGGYLE